MTSRTFFHRGILYALSELRRTFLADQSFHRIYGDALEGSTIPEAHRVLEEQDWAFGTYPAAEEMITEGMFSLLLEIDGSTFTRCFLVLSPEAARRELDRMTSDHAEAFRTIGRKLHEALQ